MPSFLFWPFAILFHPPPVFPGPLHIISLTSLPLTLVSSFCSPFQPSFQENITSSMVIHHQKFRTMRKIAVQHLKEWHCPGPVFFYDSRSVSQRCLFIFQAPQLEADLRLGMSLFLALCRWSAVALQGHFTQNSQGRDADAIKMLS